MVKHLVVTLIAAVSLAAVDTVQASSSWSWTAFAAEESAQ
jgi:Flp pilus assembly pilin Flp